MNSIERKELSFSLLGYVDARESILEDSMRQKNRDSILSNSEPMLFYKDVENGATRTLNKYSLYLRETTISQLLDVIAALQQHCTVLQEEWAKINKSSLQIYGLSVLKGADCVISEVYGKSISDKITNVGNQTRDIKNGDYDQYHLYDLILKAAIGVLKAYPKGAKNVKNYNELVEVFFENRYYMKKSLADAISVVFEMIERDYDSYRSYETNQRQKNVDIFLIEKERNKGPCIIW